MGDGFFVDVDYVRILIIKVCRNVEELKRVIGYLNEFSRKGFKIILYSGNILLIELGKFNMVEVVDYMYK